MTELTQKKLSPRAILIIAGLVILGLIMLNQIAGYASRARQNSAAGLLDSPGANLFHLPDGRGLFFREDTASEAAPAPAEPPAVAASVPETNAQQSDRLIIRNGAITLVVDDTRAANQSVVQMVTDMAGEGAFVVSSSERGATGGQPPQISITIRVPAARFTEVMDRLASMAVEVVDRTESGQDVTEEYVDVQAKVESLEAARQRLLEIVREAETTEDLLAAERELTGREQEIDSLQARLQYLEQSARLSSISIQLLPSILNQPVAPGWRPSETVRAAVETLAQRFQNFVDAAIIFAIADLPWWIAFGLAVLVAVRAVRWWLRRRPARSGPVAAPAPATTDEQ